MKINFLNQISKNIINSINLNSKMNNNVRKIDSSKINNYNIQNIKQINKVLNPKELEMLQRVFRMDNTIKCYNQSGTKHEKCLNVGCVVDIKR